MNVGSDTFLMVNEVLKESGLTIDFNRKDCRYHIVEKLGTNDI